MQATIEVRASGIASEGKNPRPLSSQPLGGNREMFYPLFSFPTRELTVLTRPEGSMITYERWHGMDPFSKLPI